MHFCRLFADSKLCVGCFMKKNLLIAPFIEYFKAATFESSCQWTLPVPGTYYLNFAFLANFCWCKVMFRVLMLICRWTTLTSQSPLENDHKRQQICQIRHAEWSAQFFKFVYFTHHSHVTRPESQSNCSISLMCSPPGFHLMFIFAQMEPESVVHPVFL